MCHSANKSINNFVAENLLHARWAIRSGLFLQGTDAVWVVDLPDDEVMEISRDKVGELFIHLVKADTGIGEEKTQKEN